MSAAQEIIHKLQFKNKQLQDENGMLEGSNQKVLGQMAVLEKKIGLLRFRNKALSDENEKGKIQLARIRKTCMERIYRVREESRKRSEILGKLKTEIVDKNEEIDKLRKNNLNLLDMLKQSEDCVQRFSSLKPSEPENGVSEGKFEKMYHKVKNDHDQLQQRMLKMNRQKKTEKEDEKVNIRNPVERNSSSSSGYSANTSSSGSQNYFPRYEDFKSAKADSPYPCWRTKGSMKKPKKGSKFRGRKSKASRGRLSRSEENTIRKRKAKKPFAPALGRPQRYGRYVSEKSTSSEDRLYPVPPSTNSSEKGSSGLAIEIKPKQVNRGQILVAHDCEIEDDKHYKYTKLMTDYMFESGRPLMGGHDFTQFKICRYTADLLRNSSNAKFDVLLYFIMATGRSHEITNTQTFKELKKICKEVFIIICRGKRRFGTVESEDQNTGLTCFNFVMADQQIHKNEHNVEVLKRIHKRLLNQQTVSLPPYSPIAGPVVEESIPFQEENSNTCKKNIKKGSSGSSGKGTRRSYFGGLFE